LFLAPRLIPRIDGELWGGFVMRKKPKKDRLEETEYVKYMYYANASDDKTVEVLNNKRFTQMNDNVVVC
jgi:hypothetical protein